MTSEKLRKIKAQRDALDTVIQSIKACKISKPKKGWIATIREPLGMSVTQLGRRTSLDATTITRLEGNEAKGVITLKSLTKLADALECELVYALVPKTSLKQILEERAQGLIEQEARRVEKTMALEDQGGGKIDSDYQKALLIGNLDKRLWEDQ